jgi:choline-sulfatase
MNENQEYAWGPGAATSQRQPNILVIMTDQHRYDLMTCAGRSIVPTPNIDRIAMNGVRFANAYCPYPVCVASRMSLLSGLYAHHTGAINNTDRLDWRYRTIAHHFTESGYLTALIGKMHFNDAHNHGFEYYLSINDWLMYLGPKVQIYANEIASHPMTDVFTRTVIDDGAGFPDITGLWSGASPWAGHVVRSDFRSMASQLEAEDHLDAFIARETVKFMQRYADQPFLLFASFMKPHTPFFPPQPWADMYPIEQMALPDVGPIKAYPSFIQQRIKHTQSSDEHQRKAHRAGYLGNLAFVDVCIGSVLDALEELGLQDDTIVVYTSDHGEMEGDHGLFQKFCLYESAVRVPLIIRYPKRCPQAKVSDALIETIGIYPTLCDLADLPQPISDPIVPTWETPSRLDAVSFAELVRNPEAKGPDYVFSEYALRSRNPQYMVRSHRYKYIHTFGGECHELYDLMSDPGEYRNLLKDRDCPGIAQEHLAQLLNWFDLATNPFSQGWSNS